MTLTAGTRLGPYEILSPLGAGGMGEVYRAKDTRLGRDVAIKVLPARLSENPEAHARFEREARAVAALSHPNILSIFDVGRQDGIAYAVTELLEGETLRSKLAAGALPARKAVDYATQIARGLAAAHGKGVVHRDLKPENVFVATGGHVKILDFGLARIVEIGDGDTRSPTAVPSTEPGTVMGTVGYMSPEQVRGQSVDHRSDVFSFGAVLYEMLSGGRAFQRESPAETMAAIARENPAAICSSQSGISAGLDQIVQHCLEKSPAERFQTADDLAFALGALSGDSAPRMETAGSMDARRRRAWRVAATTLAALAAAGLAYVLGARGGAAKPPTFHRLTFRRGIVHAARFSADGRTVVYSAAWQGGPPEIYSTRIDGVESRSLGLEGANLLALAPNDEMAITRNVEVDERSYWSVLQGTLAEVPLAGGAPRDLLQNIAFGDYRPDDRSLVVVHGEGAQALEAPPGKELYRSAGWITNPRVSPGGREVAFLDHRLFSLPGGDVCVVDRTGKKRILAAGFLRIAGLAWSPDGREVWFTASREGSALALYAVTLSGRERLLFRIPGTLILHDVSRDGRVLLAREEIRRESRSRGPGQEQERDISWLDYSDVLSIADDGTVLFVEMGDGGGKGRSLYLRKSDGSPATLVASGSSGYDLSRDGKWILTISALDSPNPRIVLVPTGPGQPIALETAPMVYQGCYFSPDAKRVFFLAHPAGRPSRWYVQEIRGGPARPVTPEGVGAGNTDFASASADGETIFVRDANGEALLWPVRGGQPRKIAGFDPRGEAAIGVASDGSLFVSPIHGIPLVISRLDPTTGTRRPLLNLVPPDPAGVSEIDIVGLTPDGRGYAYSYIRRSSDLYVVDGLK